MNNNNTKLQELAKEYAEVIRSLRYHQKLGSLTPFKQELYKQVISPRSSDRDLARILSVSNTTISNWKKGMEEK